MCMGTMISRAAVLTAAVCVCNPVDDTPDRRPINVVAGSTYRHPRRGIKVQVIKILVPKSKTGVMFRWCGVMLSTTYLPFDDNLSYFKPHFIRVLRFGILS